MQRMETKLRILVLGAGGIGGYYGGRLAQAGLDVTFLVRPRRAAQLAADGLVIKSPLGDATLNAATVLREQAAPGYDAILLSCKSYDLEDAIDSIRPAADGALIVPLLNGLLHLDRLDHAFGADNVAGGVAAIGAMLEPDGTVRHLNELQTIIFGERSPAQAARCAALAAGFAHSSLTSRHSKNIMQDMWEKFVFLSSIAGMTCLMRDSIGAICRTDNGAALMEEMLEDCAHTAAAAGYAPRPAHMAFCRTQLLDRASTGTASMLRDLRQGGRVEADHVIGDMLMRARAAGRAATLLRAAYTHLQVYEARLAQRE